MKQKIRSGEIEEKLQREVRNAIRNKQLVSVSSGKKGMKA